MTLGSRIGGAITARLIQRPAFIEDDALTRRFVAGMAVWASIALVVFWWSFTILGAPKLTMMAAVCTTCLLISAQLEARLGGVVFDQADGFLLMSFLILDPAQSLTAAIVASTIRSVWSPSCWYRVANLGRMQFNNVIVLAVALIASHSISPTPTVQAGIIVLITLAWRIAEVVNDGFTVFAEDASARIGQSLRSVWPTAYQLRVLTIMSVLAISTALTGWACAQVHPALITLVLVPPVISWFNSVLEIRLEDAERRAGTDALTGLLNRGRFFDRLDEYVAAAARYNAPLAVILSDLDNFKRVNDTLGHLVGDEVLKATADGVRDVLDPNLFPVARYGGEEFIVALPIADRDQVLNLAERVRASVEQRLQKWGTTTSIGVSYYEPHDRMESLVDRADKALYAAKHAGKNQVRECREPSAPSTLETSSPVIKLVRPHPAVTDEDLAA